MSTLSYNLIDRPWVPCLLPHSVAPVDLSLRDTLARSAEIQSIADPSPLVTVALHRLLLALLHRNFGPRDTQAWGDLWERNSWDTQALDTYFARWYRRFNLFDPSYPFYQTASLDIERYGVPIARLVPEFASGNNATLFDHTIDRQPLVLSAARAARCLVAQQAFSVGGLVSFEDKADKSADAAPLARGVIALVRGGNLFQTLMLNLHQYDPETEVPFPSHDDRPAWERDEPTRPLDRHPDGYLDLLTWQSRRIRLAQTVGANGTPSVARVVIMKGYQFPSADERHGRETMMAFRHNPRAKANEDPWPVVALQEKHALWRDSLAFFQSLKAGEQRQERPKILDWLGELAFDTGVVDQAQTLPLELYGLATNKAKLLFWHHERLPLPLAYLHEQSLRDRLREALALADERAQDLDRRLRLLAKQLLAPTSDDPQLRQPRLREDILPFVARLGGDRLFWSRLALPFSQLLVDLAADRRADEDGTPLFGETAFPAWERQVGQIAAATFRQVTRSLDTSARSLKAVAIAANATF